MVIYFENSFLRVQEKSLVFNLFIFSFFKGGSDDFQTNYILDMKPNPSTEGLFFFFWLFSFLISKISIWFFFIYIYIILLRLSVFHLFLVYL